MKKTVLTLFLIASITAFSQGAGTNGAVTLKSGYSIDLEISSSTNKTRLTLVAPSNVWFGVGFSESGGDMTAGIDVFRSNGTEVVDAVTAGNVLPPSDGGQDQDWTIISNTTNGNVRTMVVERDNNTGDADDYVFSATAASIAVIWAHGNPSNDDTNYQYHGGNRGSTVINTLSTKEIKNLDFEVFPNPTTEVVNVQLPTGTNSATAKVFDTSGRLIATQEISNPREQINISTLSSGIYVLRISSEGRFGARRIIKN